MKKLALLFFSTCFIAMLMAMVQEKPEPVANSNLRPTQVAGRHLLDLKECTDCHTLGPKADDKLTPMTNKRSDEWFAGHVDEESTVVLREETSERRRRRVLQDEIIALNDFLFDSSAEEKKQIEAMQENIFAGAYLFYQNNCLNCHIVAGAGKEIGPTLTEVGDKRDHSWFIKNLNNPQQFAPESVMPRFDTLPLPSLEKMADYLTTLKKQ
jgi:cbb3-type cytochrome oxidase cytochrome c subunit